MTIIGRDLHTRYQQIAMLDTGKAAPPVAVFDEWAPRTSTGLPRRAYGAIRRTRSSAFLASLSNTE
ncbi:MAG: hypothetical protein ABSG72_01660 [Candidatus Sulfotelmatobacter sp.]|jgi:hypothetical protein